MKLLKPLVRAISNSNLYKSTLLTLMFNGQDYAIHFVKPHSKGFCSNVISKMSAGKPHDSVFF